MVSDLHFHGSIISIIFILGYTNFIPDLMATGAPLTELSSRFRGYWYTLTKI